jgi:hypothetical protein
MIDYVKDRMGGYRPALYPGEKSDDWEIPEDVHQDYSRLNSIIETKYTREFLKICAFYNKMFPSLKESNYVKNSYNVAPFTTLDQERDDTGTGISCNYLKQIIDQVVARIGTISFEPQLLADVPSLEYIMHKDAVEQLLRKVTRDENLSRMTMEVFHDAAILGYSHCIMDPVTHKPFKASDYEIGMYEPQFNKGEVKHLLYRDYAFPVTSLVPYLKYASEELQETLVEGIGAQPSVDLKMFFDCPGKQCIITVNKYTLEPVPYPFDEVQMVTFGWDIGFSKVTSTSLFDLLYPLQREINKMNAKVQQLIRMYKGAVPVFNADVDIAMKAISNGAGEALYIDTARPVTELMTVINPTPLDPTMTAEITSKKQTMAELAGVQSMSLDMENMRSAAAVIAVDQTRDTTFQAQLDGIATFSKKVFRMLVSYNAGIGNAPDTTVPWADIETMLSEATIDLKPVHSNDPLGNKNTGKDAPDTDYQQLQTSRYVPLIMKGEITYDDMSFIVDKKMVALLVGATMVKLDALGLDVPETLLSYIVSTFVDAVQNGEVQLGLVA